MLSHVASNLYYVDDEVVAAMVCRFPGLATHVLTHDHLLAGPPGAVVLDQAHQRGLPTDLVVRLLIEQPTVSLTAVLSAAADLIRADA